MISEKEVRIGNLIAYKSEPFIISSIGTVIYCGPLTAPYHHNYKQEELEPIPLTPELLKGAGFKWREHLQDWYIKLKYQNAILIYKNNFFSICPSNAEKVPLRFGGHLHELQNLFFSLTDEELTINL